MDVAECVICYKKMTEEIMMCPKDGNTILCMPCISQLRDSKCPVCKKEVKKEQYTRNRPLEKLLNVDDV